MLFLSNHLLWRKLITSLKRNRKPENETPVDPRNKNHNQLSYLVSHLLCIGLTVWYCIIKLVQSNDLLHLGYSLKSRCAEIKYQWWLLFFKTLWHNEGYFAHVYKFIHTCRKIPIHITLIRRFSCKIKYLEGKSGTRLTLPWRIYLVPIQMH